MAVDRGREESRRLSALGPDEQGLMGFDPVCPNTLKE